jgi:GR25 family glycosyltransferase involved in LPS biosynthesis
MELPDNFPDFLKLPVFLISVDQTKERFHNSVQRIQEAGFTNIQVCQAIRGDAPPEVIRAHWDTHPPIQYDYKALYPGPMGCLLSHLALLKHIITNDVPAAVVFEDDVLFHTQWHTLAPQYYQHTPKTTDMIYMGHHCGNAVRELAIYRIPVFCTHAFVITKQGAQRLYDILIKYPYPDTHQIDMMLVRIQNEIMMEKSSFVLDWLVWNSEMFPDPETAPRIHPHVVHKDKGLVFQEDYNRA